MSDLPPDAAPPSLADLVGGLWTYQQLAAALNCSERAIYNEIARLNVPYTKILNRRYVDPAAFRAALAKQQHNTAPRGRGRPRKHAA